MDFKDGAYKCFVAFYKNKAVAVNFTYTGIKSDIYRLILEKDTEFSADMLDYRIKEYLTISRNDLAKAGYSGIEDSEYDWDYTR